MENPNSDLVPKQPPIIGLFQIIRDILITHLTATDLSMFLAATGTTVTPNQKKKFLNPVRDLGEQNDVAKLISAGFGVTIAGVDCYLLMERIAMPVTYCKKYGRRKQLQFMALVEKPTSDVLQSAPVHVPLSVRQLHLPAHDRLELHKRLATTRGP
jgi:hypothetical protein